MPDKKNTLVQFPEKAQALQEQFDRLPVASQYWLADWLEALARDPEEAKRMEARLWPS